MKFCCNTLWFRLIMFLGFSLMHNLYMFEHSVTTYMPANQTPNSRLVVRFQYRIHYLNLNTIQYLYSYRQIDRSSSLSSSLSPSPPSSSSSSSNFCLIKITG